MLSALTCSAIADTVILKSGERIEGKVTEDNDKTLTITVQVTPSISDDRTIPKSEIAKVSKAPADEVAYQAIMNIQTGPNSLAPDQYTQLINRLTPFLQQYRNSIHAIDIQQTINGFEAERKRVLASEVKMNGEWLTKEQTRKLRIQVGGTFTYEAMKSQAASGDLIGALNSLATIEKSYPGAAAYPDAVDLAKQILNQLKPLVDGAMADLVVTKKVLEKGWKDAGAADRTDMMNSYKRQQARLEAADDIATKNGQWPPFSKESEKCLKDIQSKIPTEQQRLALLPVNSYRTSVQLSTQAEHQFASGEVVEAKAALKDALAMWPLNEAAKRVQEDVNQIKSTPKPVEIAPEPVPAKAATPAPATPAAKTAKP
jgi:hypothetical protein